MSVFLIILHNDSILNILSTQLLVFIFNSKISEYITFYEINTKYLIDNNFLEGITWHITK